MIVGHEYVRRRHSVTIMCPSVISQMKAQVNARLDLTGQVGWATSVTAYGFMTPPALLGAPPAIDTTRVRVRHPIVCVPLGRAIAVVGCGHSTLTRCTELSAIVQHLRIGSEHTVSDLSQLVAVHDGEVHQHLLKMVGELVSCRALEVF